MSSIIKYQKGTAILETVIYIFIFILLTFAVVMTLFSASRSYGKIRSSVALETSAQSAMERMSRETRDSISIDTASSTFATNPGMLTLNTYDSNGNTATIRFYVSNHVVRIKENEVDVGPLTSSRARVNDLTFYRITNSSSTAVRIVLTLESGSGDSYKVKTFRTTEVLRGTYAP